MSQATKSKGKSRKASAKDEGAAEGKRHELPPLAVAVKDKAGKIVRTFEVADPRAGICASYNGNMEGDFIAEPIGLSSLRVEFVDAAGEVVGHSELVDPRSQFCEIFNGLNCGITAKPAKGGAA